MNKTNYIKLARGAFALTAAWVTTAIGHADFNYHIDINTSSLVGAFSLDFQLNGGIPLANTATISNFTFGGGSASGSPTAFGSATGSLGSTVVLNDSANFFNELYEGFTPGSTLGFDVTLTGNVNTPTPDLFAVAILDSSLPPLNIPTTDTVGDQLFYVNLDGPTVTPLAFSGTGAFSGVTTTITVIPEAGTTGVAVALGIGCLALLRRRQVSAA